MYHVIVKPDNRKGVKILAKAETRLKECGIDFCTHYTQGKGDGRRIARELTEAGETVLIVVGGDGMLNDVLCGLKDPSLCTLGLVPAGTGNDFAASLGIPCGLPAFDIILAGKTAPVDYIAFSDGRRSLNITGVGMDVDILARCERMKHLHAKSKYLISLLKSLCAFRGCRIRVVQNGEETEHNAMIAAVCNGKQLGGGIPLCPPAVADDGVMELVVVDTPPRRSQLLGALIKLLHGKMLTLPFARHYRCTEAKIILETPDFAQYDGELRKTAALEARLVAGGLNMFRGDYVKST